MSTPKTSTYPSTDSSIRALYGSAASIRISVNIVVAKAGGGYIYHSEHSVPEDVLPDNLNYSMKLVRLYAQY